MNNYWFRLVKSIWQQCLSLIRKNWILILFIRSGVIRETWQDHIFQRLDGLAASRKTSSEMQSQPEISERWVSTQICSTRVSWAKVLLKTVKWAVVVSIHPLRVKVVALEVKTAMEKEMGTGMEIMKKLWTTAPPCERANTTKLAVKTATRITSKVSEISCNWLNRTKRSLGLSLNQVIPKTRSLETRSLSIQK